MCNLSKTSFNSNLNHYLTLICYYRNHLFLGRFSCVHCASVPFVTQDLVKFRAGPAFGDGLDPGSDSSARAGENFPLFLMQEEIPKSSYGLTDQNLSK